MFDNIGSKIKSLARAFTWLGIAASVIIGLFMWGNAASSRDSASLMMAGFGIMIGGSLAAWISAWLLYGYGELIDKTSLIADVISAGQKTQQPAPVSETDDRRFVLERLRDQNLISEDEYLRKKAMLDNPPQNIDNKDKGER